MKISLIDNGLDSLTKGYEFLKRYEELKTSKAGDTKRFSVLKDAILSIQHGIEILFKYLLKENNEVLLFSEVNSKLKAAYRRRTAGEISELFEADGVHTVTFRESIERVNYILGIQVSDKLEKILLKIEKWRNGIIHSAALLNEDEVSSVLFEAMSRLDEFFGPNIGERYQSGQGRHDLDRAYRLFKAIHGSHANAVKEGVVSRLIKSLAANGIKGVKSPGVFVIKDANTAFAILQSMQGEDATYGCDFINLHCSGRAYITTLAGQEMTISSVDNRADYKFNFSGLLVFVPEIKDEFSPLVFLYSGGMAAKGEDGKINDYKGFQTQEGILLVDSNEEIWSRDEFFEFHAESEEENHQRPSYRGIFRFLSKGMICFLNIQSLSHGSATKFLYERQFDNIDRLHEIFQHYIENE
jgi:SpoU rRNA methylase family enzyme